MSDFDFFRFPHRQGRDCATATIRNLLDFNGLNLSEAMVFGLGYGLSFWYCRIPEAPFPVLLGQNLTLEEDCCTTLGFRFIVHEPSSIAETEEALNRVRRGLPTIVKADPYYLDYCWRGVTGEKRQHFGEHVLVVVGISGDKSWLSDIWSEELECAPLSQLQAARAASDGYSFLLPRNRWYEICPPDQPIDWSSKIEAVAAQTAQRMLVAQGQFGIVGIRNSGNMLCEWSESVSDSLVLTALRIISQRLEEGVTGSCFRSLFSEFLIEGGQILGNQRLKDIGQEFESEVVPQWQCITQHLNKLSGMSAFQARAGLKNMASMFEEVARQEERLCRQLHSG